MKPSEPTAIPFQTTADLAASLRAEAVAAREEPLFLLPFNRYDATNTFWWLSPSSENPAYKYGKLVVAPWSQTTPAGDFFVGFAVEKGLGEVAETIYGSQAKTRRWLMDPTWSWRAVLMPALRSGALDETARAAERSAGQPLTVWLDAAYANDAAQSGDLDLQSPGLRRDVISFEFADGRLELADAELPVGILAPVQTDQDLSSLASSFDALPDSDWIWIDFHIGVRLARSPGPPDWLANDIWERSCRPWLAWVR